MRIVRCGGPGILRYITIVTTIIRPLSTSEVLIKEIGTTTDAQERCATSESDWRGTKGVNVQWYDYVAILKSFTKVVTS